MNFICGEHSQGMQSKVVVQFSSLTNSTILDK